MSGLEELRERVDVVEVVGDYVQLKRSGRSYKGLCPFHDEKTPSFIVFPDSGNWRCFGACAVGGDSFDFVMRMENLDFRGAMEQLARRYGVVLEEPSPAAAERQDRKERLREATAAAAEFFQLQLMRSAAGEPARAYLRERDFDMHAAQTFGLGWAPEEWSALAGHLKAQGFEEQELLDAGLVKPRESGGVYDAFRGRLVFPIHDARGRPIGFGARTLDPEGVPKYLNSPQSEIFDKSHVLYGLHRAARAIRSEETAVVVEGYTDVIRAHAAGFENVVASLGTAITEHQLKALKRYAPTMVLALDADAAGQAATLRGLQVAREAAAEGVVPVTTGRGLRYAQRVDVDLRVVSMPAGKDPDDVIREGPANWRKLVRAARPVMDYLFDVLTEDLDLRSPGGKTVAAERLLPAIAEIGEPVARSAWLSRLAEMIQVDEQALGERLGELLRQQRQEQRRQQRRRQPGSGDPPRGGEPGARAARARGGGEGRVPRIPSGGGDDGAGRRKLASGGGRGWAGKAERPPSTGAGRSDAGPNGPAGDDPPLWATEEIPLDRQAASAPPDGEPFEGWEPWPDEAGEARAPTAGPAGSRPGGAAPARPRSSDADAASDRDDLEPDPYAARPRVGADELVAWLLGNLLVDPRRLAELNKLLARDQEPPLGPGDFSDHFQRDLMAALGYASAGVAPPDAPAEHRLEVLPEPLASYARELRERALGRLDVDEDTLATELRGCCLRLRKRELSRALPGLRYLMAEADDEAQMRYAAKVVELTRRLASVTKLLSPLEEGRPGGKVDHSVM